MPLKKRLDHLLVERGLVDSPEKARALIMAGQVIVEGQPATKAGMPVAGHLSVALKAMPQYVGRGGLKLEGAASHFQLNIGGAVCADVGSSTGGFTQFLLLSGASRVYAIDVDSKQLDWQLRQDARVVPIEKNARFLEPSDLGEPVSVVSVDVSFISLTAILPRLPALMTVGGHCAALVKPQFEVARDRVGKGGIVRDPEDWRSAIDKCIRSGVEAGLTFLEEVDSPIAGREGNREFFVHFQKP